MPKADFAQFATSVRTLNRQRPQLCSQDSLKNFIANSFFSPSFEQLELCPCQLAPCLCRCNPQAQRRELQNTSQPTIFSWRIPAYEMHELVSSTFLFLWLVQERHTFPAILRPSSIEVFWYAPPASAIAYVLCFSDIGRLSGGVGGLECVNCW